MTKPPLADVPIRTEDDLTRRWEHLLEPPIFGGRSFWMTWIDPGGFMRPPIFRADDFPEVLDPELGENLRRVHIGVAQQQIPGGGRLALALCRPGPPPVTKDDLAMAKSLDEAFDGVPIARWPTLHVAAAGSVLPVDMTWARGW